MTSAPTAMSPELAQFLLHDWPASGASRLVEALAQDDRLDLLRELAQRAPDAVLAYYSQDGGVVGGSPAFNACFAKLQGEWDARPKPPEVIQFETPLQMVARMSRALRAGELDVRDPERRGDVHRFLDALIMRNPADDPAVRRDGAAAFAEALDRMGAKGRMTLFRHITSTLSHDARGELGVLCGVWTAEAVMKLCDPRAPFPRDFRLKALQGLEKPLTEAAVRPLLTHDEFTLAELAPLLDRSKVGQATLLQIAVTIPSTERSLAALDFLAVRGADVNERCSERQAVRTVLERLADHALVVDAPGARMAWLRERGADLSAAMAAVTPTARAKFQFEALWCLLDQDNPQALQDGLAELAPFGPDANGGTLLHHALARSTRDVQEERRLSLVRLAIEVVTECNGLDASGRTPLLLAIDGIRMGKLPLALIDELVAGGADVQRPARNGELPLEAAFSDPRCFAQLLRHGADVDARRTPLLRSVREDILARGGRKSLECALILQAHDALSSLPPRPAKSVAPSPA